MDDQSLTGQWHGQYSYPHGRAVFFSAEIVEEAGAVSGTTEERGAMSRDIERVLTATLDGKRNGSEVSFRKTYDGRGGWRHAVQYRGKLNADGEEIEGTWSILYFFTGRFLMIRARRATEAARTEETISAR